MRFDPRNVIVVLCMGGLFVAFVGLIGASISENNSLPAFIGIVAVVGGGTAFSVGVTAYAVRLGSFAARLDAAEAEVHVLERR